MTGKFKWKMLTASCLVVLVTGVVAAGWLARSKVHVGREVPASQQVSIDRIDHRLWDWLLSRYVDDRGRVNYRAWKASREDTQLLRRYLDTLSTASISKPARKEAKLAFWINAYNAVTVQGILREYPTSSIRNHTAAIGGYNVWKDLLLGVGGQAVSLEQMEHQILRKMGEPRIHFAIVCASQSCPRLLNRAYTAENLDEQLTTNTRAFFADSKNFRYHAQSRRFHLSSILKWFGKDFGSGQAAQLKAISPYLPTKAAYQAAQNNTVNVSYLDYDWSLNEQKAAGR